MRRLDPARDVAAVRALIHAAADYALLETGLPPPADCAEAFFADRAPGAGPDDAAKFGLEAGYGALLGLADLCFGFPEPRDAYVGLLLLAPAARGAGHGARLLAALRAEAEARGAPRLFAAVLDANPRGRAFWTREGFRVVLTLPPAPYGARTHVLHRMVRDLAPGPAAPS